MRPNRRLLLETDGEVGNVVKMQGKRKMNDMDGWFSEQNSKKGGVTAFGGRILQLAAHRTAGNRQTAGNGVQDCSRT